ncbi:MULTISPECIES: hypothetical protein [unclassified Agarivorans]|uniref:hypothetical protein n=1 Tax=unclassified Agarivorans TaxID=2636026 RepID=UPI0026E3F62B|nr:MULTISPECIES: hypothetical protein [unclassified Agarivorans]MDO6686138.1 hypothetical protein [Agarivorans sp. 3_MG-2023]MDO6716413.1 hypothetical protein [Agarivorans sp. 2_MG-2023]
MLVRISAPNAKDEHYLVDVSQLREIVDEEDLACRESAIINDAYHQHWFSEGEDPVKEFALPVIYLRHGIAKFINGRHRTLVLSKHLNAIPMAIAALQTAPFVSKAEFALNCETLSRLVIRKIKSDEVFTFPELPVEYLGFDLNLGK